MEAINSMTKVHTMYSGLQLSVKKDRTGNDLTDLCTDYGARRNEGKETGGQNVLDIVQYGTATAEMPVCERTGAECRLNWDV